MSSIAFSRETLALVDDILSRYPEGCKKSALLPVLHLAQQELGGWLSPDVMNYVAELLKLSPIEVYEVATFYTLFRLQPTGKYVLEVCQTGPCCLMGAEKTVADLEKKLGITVGQTTADGLFTLKTVECLASCGSAPMMRVDDAYYEHLTDSKLDQILDAFKKGQTPS